MTPTTLPTRPAAIESGMRILLSGYQYSNYWTQEATLTLRERRFLALGQLGESAVALIERAVETEFGSIYEPVAAQSARYAWGQALDVFGWREAR